MIYVGIDIASEKHDYFMLHHETGAVFSRSSITCELPQIVRTAQKRVLR